MHVEAHNAVARMADKLGLLDVPLVGLDLGGADHNGSARSVFRDDVKWTGLDPFGGPGIDIVADAKTWVPDKAYDIVLCTEVLEHVQGWDGILVTAQKALKPGGFLLLTCASIDRPRHGAYGDPVPAEGEWYLNVDPVQLAMAFRILFAEHDVEYAFPPGDAYAWGRKWSRGDA